MPINFIQLTQGSLDSKIRKQKKKKTRDHFLVDRDSKILHKILVN